MSTDLYFKGMHEHVGYFPTWLPNVALHPGDYGTIAGGRFTRLGALDEAPFSLPLERRRGAMLQRLSYQSKSGIEVVMGGASERLGRARIEIASSQAFLFEAQGLRAVTLENLGQLGVELVGLWREGRWKTEWVIVSEVQEVDGLAVVVADEGNAELELEAKVALGDTNQLADPNAELRIARRRGRVLDFLGFGRGRAPLTPLYKLARLKRRLWSEPTWSNVRDDRLAEDDSALEAVAFDTFIADAESCAK